MFSPKDIIDVLAQNVRQTMSPFGIPRFMVNTWYKDQDLPDDGEYLLYTGLMYQFTPYIEKSTQYLESFEDTSKARYLKYARYVPGYLSGTGLALMTRAREKSEAGQPLKNVVRLLQAVQGEFWLPPGPGPLFGHPALRYGGSEEFYRPCPEGGPKTSTGKNQ